MFEPEFPGLLLVVLVHWRCNHQSEPPGPRQIAPHGALGDSFGQKSKVRATYLPDARSIC